MTMSAAAPPSSALAATPLVPIPPILRRAAGQLAMSQGAEVPAEAAPLSAVDQVVVTAEGGSARAGDASAARLRAGSAGAIAAAAMAATATAGPSSSVTGCPR
jgi:hypothetical protein